MPTQTPTTSFELFLQRFVAKSYRKNEIIVFQGEAPRFSYVMKRGIIKVYNLTANGDEKPVGFHTKYDVFPIPWTFHKAPSALYYYEALTDIEVYLVPREEYIAYLKQHPDELFAHMERLVVDHLGSTMRLNALQHSRASDKLIYTLHYLALTQGETVGPQTVEIQLDLTHQDFANLTGLTRETTATELNKLKRLGVITYGKHTLYRVKTSELNRVLNDQFVADMQLS